MTNVGDCVVACMDGLGTGVKGIVVRMGEPMDKLGVGLTSLNRDGPRAECEKLLNLTLADITVVSADTFDARGAGSVPTGEVLPTRNRTLMDLDAISFRSLPPPAIVANANAIENAVADFIGDPSSSHLLPLHAVNAPCPARTDDERPLVVGQCPTFFVDAENADVAPLVAEDVVSS